MHHKIKSGPSSSLYTRGGQNYNGHRGGVGGNPPVIFFWAHSMWNLNSPTRNRTHATHIEKAEGQSLHFRKHRVLTTGRPEKSLPYVFVRFVCIFKNIL